ncbi:CDP-diacylglycerol--glycerol-3-phosphate 3-phosphatidyltransferase [Thiohalocapsa halophila]|uniref:CDP-diacylglycerol--glycerol-3-phosphate 3-phosphatidyltransferase n=1 Tax=Thiohalocapsa halophila TaxID=69359 RepID=UPI001907C9B8|nr:CDP-diacylglycerol--glycerol-3-phosphate 3-phosphatidyltransferase [Thiohalocapsa halophila]
MVWNIPNALTLLRIALIPVFVVIFYLPVPWARTVCALVFTLAGLTDWLDGWLARRWEQTSPLGAFLDPVADKLMVAVALVLLVQADATVWLALPAAVIIGREITVSALREWMAEIGARAQVAVSMAGKLKTTAQMVAIVLLVLGGPVLGLPVTGLGLVLLYIAALLTLWSMVLYLRAAWPSLTRTSVDTGED